MGLDLEYKKTVLADIAAIERADGRLYPAKTIYIQVSAARRRNGSFFMTQEMAKLESKHAVIIPKIEIIPEYLLIALEKAAPDGTDDTALLAEPLLKWEKITAAGPDGGYGDAGTGAAGGLRWPEKGRL